MGEETLIRLNIKKCGIKNHRIQNGHYAMAAIYVGKTGLDGSCLYVLITVLPRTYVIFHHLTVSHAEKGLIVFCELKWTGMGKFNSDDYHIYYCGQEPCRRNGVARIVNKRVGKAVLV